MAAAVIALGSGPAHAGAFPYEISSHTLDNGLTVHIVPMQSPGAVAYYTWMSVGSRDEVDEGRTGFAHFFEHLMFYGTETLGREARELQILRMGLEENAWTWFDETVYTASLSSSQLEAYIGVEGDLFQNLVLSEDDVRREAGAVYGEWRKGQASPGNALEQKLLATAFTTHTYGHDTIGYEADIADMPSAHGYALAFFDKHYRPGNATILVAGDVDIETTMGWIEAAYGEWEPDPTPTAGSDDPVEEEDPPGDPIERTADGIPIEPAQTELRRDEVLWETPTAPRLAMAWKIPAADATDPTSAALELVDSLLLSPVGPLQTRLIREDGIAYSVWGGRRTSVDPTVFTVTVRCKEIEHLAKAEQIVLEEIAALQESVDAELLDRTRDHERYSFLTGLDEPTTVVDALGWALRRNPDPASLDTYWANYEAQTPEDVTAAASTYLVDAGLTVVTLRHEPPEAEAPEEAPEDAP